LWPKTPPLALIARTAGWQPATISGPNEASAPEKGLKFPITMVEGAADTAELPAITTTPVVRPHASARLVALRNFNNVRPLMTFSLGQYF
jgi:hypothetical protein